MWGELSAELKAAHTLKEKERLVRSFKRREYIRIGMRDLLKVADTVEIIRDLAWLADVCLEAAYAACRKELVRRHGVPMFKDLDGQEKESRFCILGLGKLGGEELNFSSDIDILYLYSSDEGSTKGIPGLGGKRINCITNHEFYGRLGSMITNFMSAITSDGNIFRVDLRLRPEGSSGDIAYSLRSYEVYYESYGVTLERQALIKTRVCAGDHELGSEFIRTVKPFIYRKHLDYTAIEEIKQMKENIDRRLRRDEAERGNVKLGHGGIREIEFVIQAFQLVHGGRDEKLQLNGSLETLESLRDGGYLSEEDHAALRDAYLFLRDLENRLQISHGLQTHTLPEDKRSLTVLARKMGLSGESDGELIEGLMSQYGMHIEAVRSVYNGLFYAPAEVREPPEMGIQLDDRETALSQLSAAGLRDPQRALDNLLLLRDGPVFSHPSERSKQTFSRLLPHLMRFLVGSADPDMSLNHMERFINGSRSRDTLLSLLLEEERLLDLLMRLFGHSEALSAILIRQPNLLDTLLHPEEMVPFKSRDRFQEELLNILQPIEDWDAKLAEFRGFKQAEDLRIGLKYILGHQDVLETIAELSNLAEGFLRVALVMVEAELMAEHGVPTTLEGQRSRLTVIGMGKLGGREMNFGSDLDILMVFSGEGYTTGAPGSPPLSESMSNHLFYTRLYEGLLNTVSANIAGGYAYKVDMRLRPEGDKGSFALPLTGFESYFEREERAWVRQAMIKARPVAGDPELGRRFAASAQRFVYEKRFDPSLAREIAHNRMRM
jgi:glutamate-ammonia-ligase adenylyltransferase